MDRKCKLPIGIENFEKIRMEGFYYIDKTGLIRELLNDWGEVNLFTRPRRFGKSLNMSMLKCFLEVGCKKELFDGLEIAGETALCQEYMGKFPVISLSLKDVSGDSFETARAMLCSEVGREALQFRNLMEAECFDAREKEMYNQLVTVDTTGKEMFIMGDAALMGSLKTLSRLLQKYYGRKAIILIDEYDVPLAKAFEGGYYGQMVDLIRNLLGAGLKTNNSLQFAVLTGCLRISKESVFTGLNNLRVLSVGDVQFNEYFGFTDREVKELLEYYGLLECYGRIKEWYDGYHFGNVDVYCPWDVICYCSKLRLEPDADPEEYWSNISSSDIIRRFIRMGDGMTRRELEQLMAGEAVEKKVCQELTYKELFDSIDNLWSVLYTTGYLTQEGKPEGGRRKLMIPNQEIRSIFERQILEWFQEDARRDGAALESFCEAFAKGDAAKVQEQLGRYLKRTVSIRDTAVRKDLKENFYHGILLGLLSYKTTWSVSSNRESGDGYSDILVEAAEQDLGIVIEVKYAEDGNLEAGCRAALEQIGKNNYTELFWEWGIDRVLGYGIACYKKRCRVEMILEGKE